MIRKPTKQIRTASTASFRAYEILPECSAIHELLSRSLLFAFEINWKIAWFLGATNNDVDSSELFVGRVLVRSAFRCGDFEEEANSYWHNRAFVITKQALVLIRIMELVPVTKGGQLKKSSNMSATISKFEEGFVTVERTTIVNLPEPSMSFIDNSTKSLTMICSGRVYELSFLTKSEKQTFLKACNRFCNIYSVQDQYESLPLPNENQPIEQREKDDIMIDAFSNSPNMFISSKIDEKEHFDSSVHG